MDPLRLCIALTPLGLYLLWMARLNWGNRPKVVGGFRDTLALSLGIIGLVIAGPLDLFLPESAAFRFGVYAWLMMLLLYLLGSALLMLTMRPRVVVYNTTTEELRPRLANVVQQMDSQTRWAGDSIAMPQSGIHMHMDRSPSMRNVELVAAGNEQDYQSWGKLERRLREALRDVTSKARNQNAILFLILAVVLLMIVGKSFVMDRETMAEALREMLRMTKSL